MLNKPLEMQVVWKEDKTMNCKLYDLKFAVAEMWKDKKLCGF